MMTTKMNKYVLFLLSLNLEFVFMYNHEKPVAESVWKESCKQNSMMLNDCNWCRCVKGESRYSCEARVCREVDMFGHFNDAIRDIDVGMEGHGAWRSGQQACEPGVHYQRGDMLCICTEDGGWPSPVCRDTFRVLHPVQLVADVKTFKQVQCEPAKLYLIGCNVCFCPADGIPNPKFCTRQTCSKEDPVFDTPKETREVGEVYVQCDLSTKYKLGCQSCVCLRNNRLLCDNCTSTNEDTICSKRKAGEVFNVDCNTCQCNDKGLVYCTVKNCLKKYARSRDEIDETEFESVEAPFNDFECIEGTKYKRDCNTCYCFKRFGVRKFACTVDKCLSTDAIHSGCVEGSAYEMNCLTCQCGNFSGRKMQICQENSKCMKHNQNFVVKPDWVGYCEPLHRFMKDCNPCECLADGRTARCAANPCTKDDNDEYEPKPIAVEIVPIVKDIGSCERGSTFKIDCNVCFCLLNGDVVCTTEVCKKRDGL